MSWLKTDFCTSTVAPFVTESPPPYALVPFCGERMRAVRRASTSSRTVSSSPINVTVTPPPYTFITSTAPCPFRMHDGGVVTVKQEMLTEAVIDTVWLTSTMDGHSTMDASLVLISAYSAAEEPVNVHEPASL